MSKELKQRIVNDMAAHLRRQGKVATAVFKDIGGIPFTGCAYRTPEGLACGIGGLIKDEHYSKHLENKGANDGPVMEALIASGYPVDELDDCEEFLEEVQYHLHDNLRNRTPFLEAFENNLDDFCYREGLEYPAAPAPSV